MIGVADAFAPSYREARVRFLEAAAAAGAAIASYRHPLEGRDGEDLALDLAFDGSPRPSERLLIVSSGCHGVEGHCGSGVQVFALHDAEWRDKARSAGVSVLYLHALNPWGFSFGRRVTEDNVDLNRNFQDFASAAGLPVNAAYRDLHALLLPSQWPPDAANQAALAQYLAVHGAAALQSAVSRGQHEFADGLFFGGTSETWSNRTLRTLLREQIDPATRRIGWVDLHSGLGPSGIGERIFAGGESAAALPRARRWWGDGVTSIHDGSSVSAAVTGTMAGSALSAVPWVDQYTAIALEFGAQPLPQVLQAMRAEQWLQSHADAVPASLAESIRRALRDAFYVDADDWKGQVVSQSRQALFQAVEGLAAP